MLFYKDGLGIILFFGLSDVLEWIEENKKKQWIYKIKNKMEIIGKNRKNDATMG